MGDGADCIRLLVLREKIATVYKKTREGGNRKSQDRRKVKKRKTRGREKKQNSDAQTC